MKLKLLSVVTIIIAVLWSTNVKAETYDGYIFEAETIPGVYFYKHREDTETEKYEYHNFHSQAAIHRRSHDGDIVYCIESWETLSGAKNGDFDEVTNASLTNLSKEQINRIKKLIYFGYGYIDENYYHLDPKWYAITQYMIWLVQSPNIEHYFVESMTSKTPVNMFEREINELNRLVDSLPEPMAVTYNDTVMLGTSSIIEVPKLSEYEIEMSNNVAIEVDYDSNRIKVTPLNKDDVSITFRKRYNRTRNKFLYYLSDNYQDAMTIGDLDDQVINYNFKVETASIELRPFEENTSTKEIIPLRNYFFGLYAKEDIYINGVKVYDKDSFVQSAKSINGVAKFTNLSVGKYCIKELSPIPMKQFYDSKKIVDVDVLDSNTVYKESYYHRQKLKINLKKYLSSPVVKDKNINYSLITKEGIKFGLFNENNELIADTVTTPTGDIEFDLSIPYGKYYVKEISTLDNYYLSDFILPINFECYGNEEYQIIGDTFEIINYHKKGSINITKIDADTKEVLTGVKFAIYTKNNELVMIATTDEHGKISITLPYGKYYLRELSTLDDYELDEKLIYFNITSEIQNLELTNKLKEIASFGELQTPNLEYQPIEVELSKTDDYNLMDIYFYFISSIGLILFNYAKKNTN